MSTDIDVFSSTAVTTHTRRDDGFTANITTEELYFDYLSQSYAENPNYVSILKDMINRENLIQKSKDERREAGRKSYFVMMSRCYDSTNRNWYRFGGRGLNVCNRWKSGENGKTGWECFFEDMGPKPKGYTISRIDKEDDFYKDNCVWAAIDDENKETIDTGRPKGPVKEPIVYANSKEAWAARAIKHPKRRHLTMEIVLKMLPDKCPLLGVDLSYDLYGTSITPANYATMDRIDPRKEYEVDNIHIVSRRANTIKNDATLEELEMIVKNLKNISL